MFSRHASGVILIIDFTATEGTEVRREIPLHPDENRTGDIWHVRLETGLDHFFYGYRMDGPFSPAHNGLIYDPDTILIDPYCSRLLPRKWGEKCRYGKAPSCTPVKQDFDWEGDRPLNTQIGRAHV